MTLQEKQYEMIRLEQEILETYCALCNTAVSLGRSANEAAKKKNGSRVLRAFSIGETVIGFLCLGGGIIVREPAFIFFGVALVGLGVFLACAGKDNADGAASKIREQQEQLEAMVWQNADNNALPEQQGEKNDTSRDATRNHFA